MAQIPVALTPATLVNGSQQSSTASWIDPKGWINRRREKLGPNLQIIVHDILNPKVGVWSSKDVPEPEGRGDEEGAAKDSKKDKSFQQTIFFTIGHGLSLYLEEKMSRNTDIHDFMGSSKQFCWIINKN